ncbi:nucleotidyltransferase domain-containing protein [Yeosuana sp. MJ-SS3]|uniref:Nucleotidyltransferase domain-containing protein n=1 Tax=Gilvirhabdus luticola TaxID=3079858 RepID=A0ABU3U7Q9_9FLAO|nr:nucleotidyltransferase domain-containing protein [Yeosuana sp. MJ-SS3]MDU8886431.1 nucleotidyltransferase domain-containing protein [Yeosuana sp. MJ-SS3]
MTALKTILYFSIFNYPVTRDEIFKFSTSENIDILDNELEILLKRKIIYQIGDYYLNTQSLDSVKRRLTNNKMAEKIMPKALRISKRIASFPYVKGVALSGGLSKGCFDSEGDVDFFIITSPNKLWLARTLLILYKKIFLLNSKKYFCVNYFIGSNNLNITEKNKFTAMELVTLIPTYGQSIFKEFMSNNKWVKGYFPNKNIEENFSLVSDTKKPIISKLIEFILNNKFGDFLDTQFRIMTLNVWNKKFKHLHNVDFNIAMKSTKNVSKHHPNNFQKKVIEALNENYNHVKQKHEIILEPEHA